VLSPVSKAQLIRTYNEDYGVNAMAVRDGSLYTGTMFGIKRFSVETGALITSFPLNSINWDYISAIFVGSDAVFGGRTDGTITQWSLITNAEVRTFSGCSASTVAYLFNTVSNQLATVNWDGTLCHWNYNGALTTTTTAGAPAVASGSYLYALDMDGTTVDKITASGSFNTISSLPNPELFVSGIAATKAGVFVHNQHMLLGCLLLASSPSKQVSNFDSGITHLGWLIIECIM
jgi:WD40 repeat protein